MKKLDLGIYGVDYYGQVPNMYIVLTSEKMEEIKDIQIGDEVEIVDYLENFIIKITNKSSNSLTFDSTPFQKEETGTSGSSGPNIPWYIDFDDEEQKEKEISFMKDVLSLTDEQVDYLNIYVDVYYNYEYWKDILWEKFSDSRNEEAEKRFKEEFFKRKKEYGSRKNN